MLDLDLFEVPGLEHPPGMEMRKAIYRGSDEEGRALLARAGAVHLAMLSESGMPILRTVNAVVVDGHLAFHGAPAGEKMEGLGRPVVASADETVASIPSYFLDPARACPATTYYVSVQVEGVLEAVDDPERKARVLSALMAKYQPEGGHEPLSADHPLYAKAIAGLLVAQIPIQRLTCKAKLGQNRRPEERVRVLEQLWNRGAPGDVEAIARILARFPELGTPAFLRPRPELHARGYRIQCALADGELEEAIALLAGVYWLVDVPRDEIRGAVRASTAIVTASDAGGRMVGFARAVSDGKCAWIYDVVIAPDVRGAHLGSALMEVLLDHPAVRRVRHVRLTTRDAMPFYQRLGFCELSEAPRYSWASTEMIRKRDARA
jgi:nitroimidazol reductase NimA-like FMN-containing flavoprotein (pyridoxamine 5'-phosphate oxidase superfamily)/ribosomal protein S18 acetylase RimI-like enzyme